MNLGEFRLLQQGGYGITGTVDKVRRRYGRRARDELPLLGILRGRIRFVRPTDKIFPQAFIGGGASAKAVIMRSGLVLFVADLFHPVDDLTV